MGEENGEYYFVTRADDIVDICTPAHSAGIKKTIKKASAVAAHVSRCANIAAASCGAVALQRAAECTAVAAAQAAVTAMQEMTDGPYTSVANITANISTEQAWHAVERFCSETEATYIEAAN